MSSSRSVRLLNAGLYPQVDPKSMGGPILDKGRLYNLCSKSYLIHIIIIYDDIIYRKI